MMSDTYGLNNIDVILPVYFTKDSSYGYCLKIVGDPVITKSRSLSADISVGTTLYSSGYFEYIYSYASTKNKGEEILIQCPFVNVYRGIGNILRAYRLTPIEINAQAYGDNSSILKFTKTDTGGDRYYHHFKVLNSDSAGYSVAFRGYAF